MAGMDFVEYFGEFALIAIEYSFDVTKWLIQSIILYLLVIFLLSCVIQYFTSYDSKIRYIACYTVFISWLSFTTFVMLPFYFLNTRAGVINCLYGASVVSPVAKIIGINFELRNGDVLSYERGTAVVVGNHQSILDILGMFTKWSVMQKCTAIARKQVFYVWPFGLAAWLAGVVFIDRVPSYERTHEKVNVAAEKVCQEKAKLWIFPEGTRNKNPEKLLPFKKGAFRVAISGQMPIIPVVFSPYYFIDSKRMYFGKGKIIIEALDPIPTKGLTLKDMDSLMEKVYKLMSEKNDVLRAELSAKRGSE